MGYLNPMRGAVKVDLADDYWLLLRHLSFDENDELGDMKDDKEKSIRALCTALVDWNLDDEGGTKIPLEKAAEVFGKMPASDFLSVSTAFAKNEGVGEEDLKSIREDRLNSRARFSGEPADRSGVGRGVATGDAGRGDPPGVPDAPAAVAAIGPSA